MKYIKVRNSDCIKGKRDKDGYFPIIEFRYFIKTYPNVERILQYRFNLIGGYIDKYDPSKGDTVHYAKGEWENVTSEFDKLVSDKVKVIKQKQNGDIE